MIVKKIYLIIIASKEFLKKFRLKRGQYLQKSIACSKHVIYCNVKELIELINSGGLSSVNHRRSRN